MSNSPELRRLVQSYVAPDEALLWAGRPDPRRMAARTLGSLLFGIVWLAFTVNFVRNWLDFPGKGASGFRYDWDLPMLIFMIPFLAIGVAMLLTPAWTYLKALRMLYGITDRRVLIIVRGISKSIQSYTEKDIGLIARIERSDGSGDLLFSQKSSEAGEGRLVGIPQVRAIETLLEDVFKKR